MQNVWSAAGLQARSRLMVEVVCFNVSGFSMKRSICFEP